MNVIAGNVKKTGEENDHIGCQSQQRMLFLTRSTKIGNTSKSISVYSCLVTNRLCLLTIVTPGRSREVDD
ncbi:uncharacterized protein LAJ45_10060 [Morchella importuna]|uniref:uncharacterized protein n=1 Tax=Morchella importuna TaxID=1174673 RepID=UPI001E8D6B9F|nr:uncharacterized protein LAJ45_10060 [Morchella importuna]KAH8145918.1 hypothetical protein LAJ45_10060 [Morchella importuna]